MEDERKPDIPQTTDVLMKFGPLEIMGVRRTRPLLYDEEAAEAFKQLRYEVLAALHIETMVSWLDGFLRKCGVIFKRLGSPVG